MTASGYFAMPCVDCAVDTSTRGVDEYYMVHNELWTEAGLSILDGMLCIGCLDARIGRRLLARDFTDAPVNDFRGRRGLWPWTGSARLLDRLTDGASGTRIVA